MAEMDTQVNASWLLHIPKRYHDFTNPQTVFYPPDGEKHFFLCRVKSMRWYSKAGAQKQSCAGAARLLLDFEDARGNTAKSMVFGAVWSWSKVSPGQELMLYAKMSYWNDCLQIDQPEIISSCEVGKVSVQYAPHLGKDGVTGDEVAVLVKNSFSLIDEAVQIILDEAQMYEEEFTSVFSIAPKALLQGIHYPPTVDIGREMRLIAEGVVTEVVARRAERNAVVLSDEKSRIAIDGDVIAKLKASLPFPLTSDQIRSVDEIVFDLRSVFPMQRVLSGDVGTGKSLTFLIPAAAATLAGKLCAIITPNQLLVSQLAREMGIFFPHVPVQVIGPGGKIDSNGGLVIGTTSVLFASERGNHSFDFVITDEEHKFSVEQKKAIAERYTNLLKATATPIPRSVALISCDGMALSVLEECPVKKNIKSLLIGSDKKADLLTFSKKIINEGQVAVVYPAVFESEKLKSIEQNAAKWEALFPGQVAVLHGQMGNVDKQKVLDSMLSGAKRILIASTVIEIGVTLPDLKAMIVIHPERFGVSQLHQLRGRVSRHGGDGFFIMYCPEEISKDALARLSLVKTIENGFLLAEKDMEVRGFGDLDVSGETQTGHGKLLFRNLDLDVKRLVSVLASRQRKVGVNKGMSL